MATEFWIKRDNIRESKFIETERPSLEPNQILLKNEHFALTANNISYAQTGETLGYWQFFPTGTEGWGKLTVWGYGDVMESKHPDIAVGEHIFGFFPLASHVMLQADRVSAGGFVESSPHRQALPAVYNRYMRSTKNENDHFNSLLRPIFITSFVLDDFLADNDFFGADSIIASSASSKTAYAMAHLLHKHKSERRPYEIIGLTSPKNMDFVQSLGIYDRVLNYDSLSQLDKNQAAVYVDFASNAALRNSVHEHFGANLKHDTLVGGTHWDKVGSSKGLAVEAPEFFFAPVRIQKRLADWGREGYTQRSEAAWAGFLEVVPAWMDVTVMQGQDAIQQTYQAMLAGQSEPRAGYILSV
jgi:hypothetical protein